MIFFTFLLLLGCASLSPIAVIPCLSPYSAGPVFTEGLLANWCDWKKLDKELPECIHALEQPTANMNSRQLLAYLLDATTDLTRFPRPKCLEATIQVCSYI